MKNPILVLSLMFGWMIGVLPSPAGELNPVLKVVNATSTGGGGSFAAAMSGDARFVAFLSHANNLVTNDSLNPWMDVFLRDLANGTTTLVSKGATGAGGGNDNSSVPSVSVDGALVAFESAASNLAPDDTNGFSDVFLRNMTNGSIRLVSVAPDGTAANGASGVTLISSNGRYVVYESSASNLVIGDVNGTRDIFIYDRAMQSNRLVSTPLTFQDPNFSQNGPSHSPAMTPDGRLVAYVKSATNNLVNPPAVSYGEIYIRDTQSPTTYMLSSDVSSNFTSGSTYVCYNPTISADGQFIFFKANHGGPAASLFRRDRPFRLDVRAERIAVNAATQGWAQVSMDGRFVAYEAIDGIRVWDGQSASNRLVLGNIAGTAGRTCSLPAMSADGNRTVFLVASNETSTVYVHDWLNDSTTIAIVNSNGLPAMVSDSTGPLLSEDGQTIVFDSLDASLVSDDENKAYDVFATSLESGVTTLVSARAAALPGNTSPTASRRWPNSISANGRSAAIVSADLVSTDTNRSPDVYVRDFITGVQHFLGQSTNSTGEPVFSADGRYVAYAIHTGFLLPWLGRNGAVYRRDLFTGAEVLAHPAASWDATVSYEKSPIAISPDGNLVACSSRQFSSYHNVVIRDINLGTTNLVSVNRLGTHGGNDDSMEPAFSPDGRWLFFRSKATDLTANSPIGFGLFARDLVFNRTILLAAWYSPGGYVPAMSVSADSRFVACIVSGAPARVSVFDLQSETSRIVADSLSTRSASLSGDGRWLAYDKSPNGAAPWNIYVTDLVHRTNELISMQIGTGTPAPRSSSHPFISHDGRFVVFASDATNLVFGDANNARDIFIRDRLRGVTLLASINRTGTGSGNGASVMPILAADGRTLLFQSFASDLIAGDFNETADVFVLRLGGADSDNDKMDDDWEVAYFGSINRDGSGDFDADGTTDAVEYQLGTDPTNAGSVFQVLKLAREGAQGAKLLWSAVPGRTYRVQYQDDLSAGGWSDAAQTVTAAGTTAVWTEDAAPAVTERFYRVVLVP